MIEDEGRLRGALLASRSRELGLPAWCTFERLAPAQTVLPVDASCGFTSHSVFHLPCDFMCKASQRGGSKQGKHDTVHRLRVSQPESLNEALRTLALRMEDRARCDAGSDSGVEITNWGGFQSQPVLFDESSEGSAACADLHAVVSAAMDQLSHHWTPLGHEHYADEEQRPLVGQLHPAYAWLNVNRGHDFNFLHVHEPTKWSGVYFVARGQVCDTPAACDSSESDDDGHLIFRSGKSTSMSASGDDGDDVASHSYLAVPPEPGTLWLFPGSIPHAVLGMTRSADEPDAVGTSPHLSFTPAPLSSTSPPPLLPSPPLLPLNRMQRISVAINLTLTLPLTARSASRWRSI